ncbi:cTAGE family member 5 isoform X3 [Hemibagrus wyckioides]|uniref:cTAGE family member 5 isoform X3 n=1 Tax=Hemibagrus wyckioides TaxID=337641 RepID=UPI00266C12EE|nr:cTAGE family member 5 isoform X3 [Hemibagrus wyckioides]
MWNFSTMASLHLPILLQFILSLVQSSRLMSDYKTCGDDACARLMSRVQALRDHGAQDCRFLSFKKGDMIDVYHKLSGRRSELWAGSRDKDFGYFPKDAVKIDEVFVDEKKEIEMRAQKTDFFCMDAFGTIIVSGEEFEDYEFGAQTGESEELGNADFDHRVSKSSETNENVETRHVDNDNKDRGKAEPSRSSWIGSAVSGWFANDADEAGNENKELENFKSRKLALDMEQLNGDGDGQEDKTDSDEDSSSEQVSYLLEDGIKSLLGFGGGEILPSETKKQDENMQNLRKEQEAITENENIVEKKDAGWYDSFYNRITKFYGDPADKSEASNDEEESLSHGGTDVDKVKEEKNPDPGSESLLIQDSEGDRNAANHKKRQEVSRQDETGDSQLGEGWYGSVYNRITGLYGDTGDGSTAPDKSDVIENGRGDPPGTSDSMDVGSSPDEKPGTSDPIAERMTENNNAGWYNSIYSRITNVYGDTSDQNDVPEVMKESESQTQSESTEDTSSQSIFTRNDLSTVIDSLRGEGSQDETKVSESVRSETSDDDDDDDDDDGDEGSGLRDKENTENLTDSEQNQDISQSVFSGMINGLKSPFKPNNAGDKEESDEEKTLDTVLRPYTALAAELTSDVVRYMVKESVRVTHAVHQVVMSLPDDIRPGPDLYGVPWEAVIFTATLGLFTFMLFTCRFFQAIKSRLYCSKERRMGQKVVELLEEKCKVLETLSECEHKFKKLEAALQNGGLSAQASEKEDLEVMSKKLEEANTQMQSDLEKMQEELDTQDQLRKQQEEQLTKLEEMLKKLEQEATERRSQLEQDKMTLKIHEMNSERLQKKLQEAKEENSMLLESKAQLEQEAEGWRERLSELEEEKKMCETSHNGMMENCVNKDERIKSLTECLLKMRDWDSEEESTVNDSSGSESKSSSDFIQKQKVQKLINAAKMSADLKAMEEDKDRMFAKLTDEIKAKEDLQENLEQLQHEKVSLESESSMYSSEIEKLQHKLQIMSEMYQEKELKLHRMLTVEEKERSQKEEQLNKAGKKISLATDELNSYRQRAKELEEELEKTNQAYRNQIAAHEKKAHDNWLAARAADRDLTDVKRENSVLRQRLTDWQFKLELMEKNPQARAPLIRGERSPFGPSPLGRPPSETRPFLSPPTLMDGPPRVSPQFPMMPCGRAPPGGLEGDRSVSYSEGGSPTWERERERERERRSLGPPGPDPGLVFRRPLSAPFLRAPLPTEAYYNDKSESSFGGEGAGFSENGIRDCGRAMPGPDVRAGPLPPFPPVDPRDPHFPRRVYRPDFFPPPPLTMRGPPPPLPPGVFPRIPLPPHAAFPLMRPPTDHVSPEPPSRPSPPGSEQPPEQPPSAHII